MSERPFMQLYVSDFIGDTLQLSTEQIGAYMLLLMAMWNAGGKLPSDDGKLARVARLSVKKWKSIGGDLMPFFVVEAGTISHNRLTKELQKSERKSQLRASAGAEGGRAKALKYKDTSVANAKREPQHLPDTIIYSSSFHSEEGATSRAPSPTDRAIEVFSEHAEKAGLPVPRKVTADRRRRIEARLREHGNDAWAEACRRMAASSFCRGENDRGWRADLDFLCQPKSFNGLIEGKYDDRPHRQSQEPPRQESEFARHQREGTEALERRVYGDKRNDQFASDGPAFDLEPGDYRAH